ncbi:hypothetical protein L873DRAFT_1848956 [Choiromyces venosus 120613-1]|uniref:C2H2-type domain-containing protein n=1 Tax=Choiromyces venosus 120613-1 TaxID=1336337 RepID=A0A3N4J0Y5_9PEZI|nr:hypothetical protein L873DRAFT_1848956 [Choiromyces venosus 120613-1]
MLTQPTAGGTSKKGSARIVYRYNCHTCNVHFSSCSDLGDHHLAFHRPLNCTYLPNSPPTPSCTTGQETNLFPDIVSYDTVEPVLHCLELGCSCPRFEFSSAPHSSEACTGSARKPNLDGPPGDTFSGGESDGDFDIETTEIKLVPMSGKDQHSMKKRFNKGKFGLKQKLRDEAAGRDLEFFKAYEAADRNIFGQQRFEELEDKTDAGLAPKLAAGDEPPGKKHKVKPLSSEKEKARLDSWKREVGLRDLQKEKKEQDKELQDAIESLIFDTGFDLAEREREKKRELKARKENSKLYFEDIIEDIALDHEQKVAESESQDLRKTLGKKMIQSLGRQRDEDMADEIAFDHLQGAAERSQEHKRRGEGKKQERHLNRINFDETVDNAALDHLQIVEERDQEHLRRTVGARETRTLAARHWEDVAETGALDYLQEIDEREREMGRGAIGREQNRRLARMATEDGIEEAVMGHLQGVTERAEEYTRHQDGRRQTRTIARDLVDTTIEDTINNLQRKPKKPRAMGAGFSDLPETRESDDAKRSAAFLMRFQGQASFTGTDGDHPVTQAPQEHARKAASPTNVYPVFQSPGKRRWEDEEALAQPEQTMEGPSSVTGSSGTTRRTKRPKNSKQLEYDAMVDEMVKKFEVSKRSGKNPNVSIHLLPPIFSLPSFSTLLQPGGLNE